MSDLDEDHKCLLQIMGEQLSAVSFVMDYLQLQFNGLCLTVLTPLVVHETDRELNPGDPSYRDSLCDRITHLVKGVTLTEEYLNLEFDDDSTFAISLADECSAGNEAVIFKYGIGREMQCMVIHII